MQLDSYELASTICQKALSEFKKKREPTTGSRSMDMWVTLQQFNKKLSNGNELTPRQRKILECICEALGVS